MRILLLLLVLTSTVYSAAHSAATEDELLRPEDAFRLQANAVDVTTVNAGWEIADGYYLYRHRFSFTTDTPGYILGDPVIPAGKLKQDEFFGEVETYRKQVIISLPVSRDSNAANSFVLKTVSQGCADLGVCYPPQMQEISVEMPKAAAKETLSLPKSGVLAGLKGLVGGNDSSNTEFLHPDQAFEFNVQADSGELLLADWRIAEGYYLYRDKIHFSLADANGVRLGEIELPSGKPIHDEYFGDMEIYEADTQVRVPLARQANSDSRIVLNAEYQGCAVDGICYPPIQKQVSLTLPAGGQDMALTPANVSGPGEAQDASSPRAGFRSEQDRITGTLEQGRLWLIIASFFGFGLLLSLTPCVFPMIPILSGILAGQGATLTTARAFSLSLVYVLAMAATYTMLGIAVGLSGENLQIWFQNPWVISIFAGVMILLALSMFGFYELQMPSAVQSRLNSLSNRQQGGTLIGAGIMGFLSALIVGPCVTAPLIGALVYIANTGNAVVGGVALFALSLGMGAPLLLIGASAGRFLPRAGAWMEAVKAVFGVLLLALAIWFLDRILSAAAIMVLSAILLIITAIYMGALDNLKKTASGWFRLWKGMGLVMLVYGALLLVGAAGGGNSLLQPLNGLSLNSSGQATHQSGLEFAQIKGLSGLKRALAKANTDGRPVMLDFYADWCISCKEMEKFTFTDAAVKAALNDFVKIQADVTDNDEQDRGLLKQLGLFGPPAILFYTPEGNELTDYRVVGYMPAEEFSRHVQNTFSGILAEL